MSVRALRHLEQLRYIWVTPRQNQKMPARALRPTRLRACRKTALRQNQKMPVRALRPACQPPWACRQFRQNQQMPVRALRRCQLALAECTHGIGQNQQMPVRALRPPHRSSNKIDHGMSESTNARQGIKTNCEQKQQDHEHGQVRINKCPSGH